MTGYNETDAAKEHEDSEMVGDGVADIVEEAKTGAFRQFMGPNASRVMDELIAEVEKLRDSEERESGRLREQIKYFKEEVERLSNVEEECKLALKAEKSLQAELEATREGSNYTGDLYDQLKAELEAVKKERDELKPVYMDDGEGYVFTDTGKELEKVKAENAEYEQVLTWNGFRRCDIPACNCKSWHDMNGYKPKYEQARDEISDLKQRLDEALKELPEDSWKHIAITNAEAIDKLKQKLEASEKRGRYLLDEKEGGRLIGCGACGKTIKKSQREVHLKHVCEGRKA